jgi:alpha-1,2-mannosyltransferase
MASVGLAERMSTVASRRGWVLPLLSAAVSLAGVTVLALVHRQIDLATYLLGGAHAFDTNLFQVTYPSDHLGFTYPPFSAILFAPFTHLPLQAAELIFSWLNLATLFALVAVSLKAVSPSMERRTALWWALALLPAVIMLDPVRQTFLLGQVNLILALMVVADMTMDLPLPRGLLVGVAAAVKVTPIILIPYLFMTRQSRSGLRAVGAFAGAGLLAAAVSPHDSWAYWTHYIHDPQRAGMLSWIGNQGLLGALERMLGHNVGNGTSFALTAVMGMIGLVIAALAFRRSSPVLGFLVVEATESLASPVSWSHHFIWVVLLIGWLALGVDRPRDGHWWAAGVAVLFWAAPTWWSPHGPGVRFAGRGWLIPLSDAYVFLFLALVVATAYRVARAPTVRRAGDPTAALHPRT